MKDQTTTHNESIDIELEDKSLISERPSTEHAAEEKPKCDKVEKAKMDSKAKRVIKLAFKIIVFVIKHYAAVIFIELLANYYPSKSYICPYDHLTECMEQFVIPNLYNWGIHLLAIAFAYASAIALSVVGVFSRFFIIYLVWSITKIGEANEEGYGNYTYFFEEWFIYLTQVLTGALLTLVAFFYISKKSVLIAFLIFLSSISYLGYGFYNKAINSCDGWENGIKGELYQDMKGYCSIEKPKFCFWDYFDGVFDFSKHAGYECSKSSPNFVFLKKKFPNSPVIGFPRVEGIAFNSKLFWAYPPFIMKNLVALSNMDEDKAKRLEFFVDRRNLTEPKLVVNLKKDELLIKTREEIKSTPLVKNVLAIYIDALSRRAALRHLPKTMKFLESFNPESDLGESFQFFRYHGISPWTFHVHLAMMYGLEAGNVEPHTMTRRLQRPQSPYRHIVNDFKENGFITGRSINTCSISAFYSGSDYSFRYYIDEQTFDHEGSTFACDEHHHYMERPFLFYQGSDAYIRRCLYGKDVHEYNIEYAEQFWNSYKDQKKFFWMHLFDAHEGTQSVVKYLDGHLSDFLYRLKEKGQLQDTAIMLVSDHGLHEYWLDFARLFDSTLIERALPTLFFVLPKNVTNEYRLQLKENEQKLVHAFDVNKFMKALARPKGNEFMEKTFFGNISKTRTCADLHLVGHGCYCKNN